MIDKNLDIIYNQKYLVILPNSYKDKLLKSFRYTFKNVIVLENNYVATNSIISFIKKNNFKNIIFINYLIEYEEIIKETKQEKQLSFIFTESLASFSNLHTYENFKKTLELSKEYNTKLGIIDKFLYDSLKENNKYYIKLDIERKHESKEIDNFSIGLLNEQDDPKHSYYNELSAIKLLDGYKAIIHKPSKTSTEFIKLFDIDYKEYSKSTKPAINLNINFSSTNNILFLESMDSGIPCILGNNNILQSNSILSKMLVVKSDDDVNEIANKIKEVEKNKEKILKEYEKFRLQYTIESKDTIEEFLNTKLTNNFENSYEKLLSVVVPIYNVEKYLEKSLDSIYNAKINNMEILLINDGSTDESDKIARKYCDKFPNLIRYIKQENHGLGNVRNVGLKEAKGKYIASIDSDDTINVNFFKEAEKYLKKDIDIVIYDWLTVTDKESYQTSAIEYIFNDINKYEGLLYTTIMPSTCNKIIKRDLFKELNLDYIEDKYEDLSTNTFIMLRANTIKYINKPYYEYYIRDNSIMRSNPGKSMINVIKLVESRLEKYRDIINIDIDKFKYYTYSWRIEEYVLNQLYNIDKREIKDFINYINENIKDIVIEIFENVNYKDMLNKLSSKHRKYIQERNKAFINNKLEEYIINARKTDSYFLLTPPIIYFGE